MSKPCMLFKKVIDNYYKIKNDPDGTLYAFRFPWSFAKGAKIRLMPLDKSEYIDCPVTKCYRSMVRKDDWSIEVKKEPQSKVKEEKVKYCKEKVAFECEKRGYYFRATYLKEPKGEALIEISKDKIMIKEFLFPTYKIYNIAAHADDIIDGLENQNDSGLKRAGSNGLGGNCYS